MNRDDFWPVLSLRMSRMFQRQDPRLNFYTGQNGNRMQVLSTYDFQPREAFGALRRMRKRFTGETEDPTILRDIVSRVGGRMAYLSRAARAKDMDHTVDQLLVNEKYGFLPVKFCS